MAVSAFRLDEMSHYLKQLQTLIEDTYKENGQQKVMLIGHSMGNLYILYMLNHLSQSWKDQYIKSFVSLAAPWGGAVKTIRLMTSG
jgi:triacylglycerol esterase/lipase EstA (alpha/beta hydrolase family)